ncbi:cytochrome P450 [Obba rivulosa]|uniref:Cytochrome P450 n=1 Tax=Obba rivulosa TaxID=1052685 RepID=A0A8E2DUH5_9APHY|nr:cytochrome P450 [Obba rivulosa]
MSISLLTEIFRDHQLAVLTIIALCAVALKSYASRANNALPPGPPSKPLLGNILGLMPKKDWSELSLHKERYGILVFFHGFGSNILLINSMDVMRDLLEKKANVMSNRPQLTVACELFGAGQTMAHLDYGEEWRVQRKLAHIALSQGAVTAYHPVIEDLTAIFCLQLLDDPARLFQLVRLTTGRLILAITYGLSVAEADDEYITLAEFTLKTMGEAVAPGAYITDVFPILKHLPSWIPYQRRILEIGAVWENLATKPFNHVKRQMEQGKALPSLVYHLLSENLEHGDLARFEHRVKWAAGSMYGGNVETIGSTLLTCIYLLMANPDKQRLAQKEIDELIGAGLLPVIADQQKLPYVNAVIKEAMRWSPAVPMGFPRCSSEDEVYRGYTIPKGTYVFPVVWSNVKYNHREFIPERFLDPGVSVTDPSLYSFGFGRRICPGKFLADEQLFIFLSTILATFNLEPPADGIPELQYNVKSVLSYPLPFDCRIVPRSDARAQLLRSRAAQSSV